MENCRPYASCLMAMALTIGAGASNSNATLFTTAFSETGGSTLESIDPTNGNLHPIGYLGDIRAYGLAYDTSTRTMYAVAENEGTFGQPKSLYKVDLKSGKATLVGPLGTDSADGLGIYEPSGNLYTAFGVPTVLANVNAATGQAAPVSNQIGPFAAFTYEPTTQHFLYAGGGNHSFGYVDVATGVPTILNSTFPEIYGLAIDHVTNTLFGIGTAFYSIDVTSGSSQHIADFYDGRYHVGLAYVPVPEPSSFLVTTLTLVGLSTRRRRPA